MSSSTSSFPLSRPAARRRNDSTTTNTTPSSGDLLRPAVDPAPNPRPIFQWVGFGFIIFLCFLQFLLPATHFRHPSDPLREWLPFPSNLSPSSSSSTNSKASSDENSGYVRAHDGEDGMVHIVSWMDCLDLQVLAVLINSTLSSSRYPELFSFHFFVPEGHDDKVSYYKLKVLFPHSNLEIIWQEKVKGQIMAAYSAGEYPRPSFHEMAPFVIPTVHPTLSKFIYVSTNVIFKGGVEELLGVDLKNFAIAVAEDCSKRLSAYVNFDVLDAIQRSASNPWVSGTPYSEEACMPDLSLVFIDGSRLEKNLLEAILWWSKVLNKSERDSPNPAVALALYNRHLKPDINYKRWIHRYDGGRNIYSESCGGAIRPDVRNLWKQYLPPMSDQILGY
ncbi:unnamed protein product [Camellia sinensis]